MLAAIIIISLLSLLVATDAEQTSVHAETPSPEPLRPQCKFRQRESAEKADQLAA